MRIKELLYLLLVIFFSNNVLSQDITVMSYNIRYDNPEDGVNVWNNRKENVSEIITNNNPVIVGIQEALKNQIDFLSDATKYKYIGKGRDDGKTAGEYSPILYDKSRVELLDNGMFWLSETPDSPSLGWDACCRRVVTWGKFKYKGKVFFYFNTHFDHKGKNAMKNSSKLLLDKANHISDGSAFFIGGDFNFNPDNENYKYLVNKQNTFSVKDSYLLVKNTEKTRPITLRSFDVKTEFAGDIIDYIFIKNNISVISYRLDTSNNGSTYYSDHVPVIIKAKFNKE